MGKKLKDARRPQDAGDLRSRVEAALAQDRTQTALDLAKQLHRNEPTPAHKVVLQRAYLARARQLRGQGQPRDAANALQAAMSIFEGAYLAEAAQELAACGAIDAANGLVQRTADPAILQVLREQAADAAISQATQERQQVAAELQPDYERIVRAFAQLEAGQDDSARETLQGIGLNSPFLEWKVLLRGLAAYYQGDDARALENWQRLRPERLPARLIAALRFSLDPAYAAAQPAAVQASLQKRAQQLQGSVLVTQLRDLRDKLGQRDSIGRVLRLAEPIVTQLRQQAPHLLPRLGNVLQWAVIHFGEPENAPTYARLFGLAGDDADLQRLLALGYEFHDEFEEAHGYWKKYEQAVAAHPERWPPGQAQRIRALVWAHAGENAALDLTEDLLVQPPSMRSRNAPPPPRHSQVDAAQCFQRAIELAPDLEEAHAGLISLHLDRNKPDKAEAAARRYLECRPDHLPTLVSAAAACGEQGKHGEAVKLLERACQVDPLDEDLRQRLLTARLFLARGHVEAGRFDDARAIYRAELAAEHGADAGTYRKWAACEFKAGDLPRAEELLGQARNASKSQLGLAYAMVTEARRLKLPKALLQRFERELKDGLARSPSGVDVVDLIELTAAMRLANVKYVGQQGAEKSVLAYVDKAKNTKFTEEELLRACAGLLALDRPRALKAFVRKGQQQFRQNPEFYYLEAQHELRQLKPGSIPPYQISHLLERALQLARQQPPSPKRDELLEQVQKELQVLAALNPFLAMLGGAFAGNFANDADDDYADEEIPW